MITLKTIPDDVKWRLAARCAATIPAMYESAFRETVGSQYDKLEQKIWIQLAHLSLEIAGSLQLPVKTAQELAESLRTVTAILFGPDYKGEVLEIGDDGAVVIIRHCPHIRPDIRAGTSPDGIFHRCMAFTLSSQNILNRKFTSRFVRAMCMGDRQCELKIEPVQETEEKKNA